MHDRIFVVSYKNDASGHDENSLCDLFGADRVDYVSTLSDGEVAEEKADFVKIARRLVGKSFKGNAKSFSFDKDTAVQYAKSVIDGIKNYFAELTVDELAKSFSRVTMEAAIEPYHRMYVVDPDGCPMSFDDFVKEAPFFEGKKLYIESVFDYHY